MKLFKQKKKEKVWTFTETEMEILRTIAKQNEELAYIQGQLGMNNKEEDE